MITSIRKMSLKTGNCLQEKIYSLSVEKALIAYFEQEKSNYNTWQYPTKLNKKMHKSKKINTWFVPINNDIVIYAEKIK